MVRVLHLSDLHFGLLLKSQQEKRSLPPSAHRFVDEATGEPDPKVLAEVLLADQLLAPPPDIVVVSGDVGWSGAAADYKFALAFLQQLKAHWNETRFVLAPGNHDVNWARLGTAPGSSDESQNDYLQFIRDVHGESALKEIYSLLELGPPLERESLVGFYHGNVRGQSYVVVSVNSAAHIAGQGKEVVHVRPTVLKKIADTLRSTAADLRIFVLHHHLLPFAEHTNGMVWDARSVPDKPDSTIVANSAKLQGWLAKHGFSLALHGHKHDSHGRVDVMWRKTDADAGRRLFIVGAGSAGVATHERGHNVPLTYNLVTLTQLSSTRWQADVAVRRVDEQGPYPEPAQDYDYTADIGPPSDAAPIVVHATRADQCHEAIHIRAMSKGVLHNFVSIVDDGQYVTCPSASNDGQPVPDGEIDRSFQALHPEFSRSLRWRKLSEVEAAVSEAGPRFQFSHGPRLFGIPDAARKLNERDLFRPIVKALDTLKRGSTSNAYVGLFRPEIDVVSYTDEPLPALVGLQFIPTAGNRLALVATFRKLELSYWWVVNMRETAELLEWGSNYCQRKPGRITFFAPLAEWKQTPETTFVPEMDSAGLDMFVALFLKLARSDNGAAAEVIRMLEEKRKYTNEKNIDLRGLKTALSVLNGLRQSGHDEAVLKALSEALAEASTLLETAMREHRDDDGRVLRAREALDKAITHLQALR